MKNKKSLELSINVVIIAAIGLIVFIVLALIFRGESNKFVKSTDCPARGGVCLNGLEDCPDDKTLKIYTNDCPEVELKENMYVKKEKSKGPGQCCIALG